MRASVLVQATLVKIYIALVQTIDYMENVHVVYIKRMESKPTRSRDFLLRRLVISLLNNRELVE